MDEKQTDYIAIGVAAVIIFGLIVGLSYLHELSNANANTIEYKFDYPVAETFDNNESVVVYYTVSITDSNSAVTRYDVMNSIDPISVCATNEIKDVLQNNGPSVEKEEIDLYIETCETDQATVNVNTIIKR